MCNVKDAALTAHRCYWTVYYWFNENEWVGMEELFTCFKAFPVDKVWNLSKVLQWPDWSLCSGDQFWPPGLMFDTCVLQESKQKTHTGITFDLCPKYCSSSCSPVSRLQNWCSPDVWSLLTVCTLWVSHQVWVSGVGYDDWFLLIRCFGGCCRFTCQLILTSCVWFLLCDLWPP